MSAATPDQSPEAIARRREAVQQTIAINRLESIEPTADELELFERYIEGEITTKEWLELIQERRAAKQAHRVVAAA